MKKLVTKEVLVCDFCDDMAIAKCLPTDKDVCSRHYILKEVRLPVELGGEMSGHKVVVDPDYLDKEVSFKISITKK